MELPLRPYAISPCGHILCLTCLQEWFKKAPPALDDMDVVDPDELTDPSYILRRSKTCPTCRARVRRKPAPVFMVKGVVGALVKYRAGPSGGGNAAGGGVFPMALLGISLPAREPEPDASEDPWDGIFEHSSSSDEGEMDEDDDDLDDDEGTEYGSSAGSEFGMFYDHDDIDVGDYERWGNVDSEDDEGEGEERWHEGDDGGSDDEHGQEGLNVRGGEGQFGGLDDHDEDEEEPQIQRARPARSRFPFGSTASPSPPPPASLTLSLPLHLPLAISVPMPMPIIQQNQYVLPRWEPPNIELLYSAEMMRMLQETMGGASSGNNESGSTSGSDSPEIMMKLLRRGCTLGMLQSFEVTYTHTDGIIVFLRSLDHLYASDSDREDGASDDGTGAEPLHRVFLGWNVYIDDEDEDGEEFMVGMLEDMKRCAYRWRIEPRASEAGARLGGGAGSMGARRPSGTGPGRRAGGAMDARRLVLRDEVWDYESEGSESWVVGGGRRY
ncbi:hypothetical protein BJ165DRAFT_1440144 [Panaeolus papilionaceus]|nr:hypothetical protein BJ165DRAFT_1440144 [Panaeolus papilionaceus]